MKNNIKNPETLLNTNTKGSITMKTTKNTNTKVVNSSKTINFSKSKGIVKGKSIKVGRLTATTINEKLQPSEFVEWLLFSTLAIVTCPFATEHCKADCYGNRGVYRMPSVKNMLTANTQAVQDPSYDWISDMIAVIRIRLNEIRKTFNGAKTLYFRVNVVGDYYNQEYFDKWMYIASQFSSESDIKFVCYTKSLPYVADYCKRHNATVEQLPFHFISSIWDDTKESMVELTKTLGLGTYSAGLEWAKSDYTCNCEVDKCSTCRKCYERKHHITVEVDNAKARAKKRAAKAGK